jgi:hypothetical protein
MINPRVAKVTAANDYLLVLTFTNNEQKVFDMKPYLDKGVFRALKNKDLFKKAYVNWGTVVWNEDLDMSPDTLYLDSEYFEKLPTFIPAD